MRFAIISDIHGNISALQAVLQDSKIEKIDQYILLGDYIFDFPWLNETIDILSSLDNIIAIKGNKEGYILQALGEKRDQWTIKQFAALYWNTRNISDRSIDFIRHLKDSHTFTCGSTDIHIAHSPVHLLGDTNADHLNGIQYPQFFEENKNKSYRSYAQEYVEQDKNLRSVKDGIYLFGHFHTQWHAKVGNKIFINPGSCGLPVDYDNRSPYTILEIQESTINIVEKRIKYNTQHVIDSLKNSSLYQEARIWSSINIIQLYTAREVLSDFLKYIESHAKERGETSHPFSNDLWEKAGQDWLANYRIV